MGIDLDEEWMRKAMELAKKAWEHGEVPVGAIVVHQNQIIGYGFNQPIECLDPTHHAEIAAIKMASLHQQNYRLKDCTLYATLEPCAMCAGAILHARISRVVYGAVDAKGGAHVGALHVLNHKKNTHKVQVQGGVLENECKSLLQSFFKERRECKKKINDIAKEVFDV